MRAGEGAGPLPPEQRGTQSPYLSPKGWPLLYYLSLPRGAHSSRLRSVNRSPRGRRPGPGQGALPVSTAGHLHLERAFPDPNFSELQATEPAESDMTVRKGRGSSRPGCSPNATPTPGVSTAGRPIEWDPEAMDHPGTRAPAPVHPGAASGARAGGRGKREPRGHCSPGKLRAQLRSRPACTGADPRTCRSEPEEEHSQAGRQAVAAGASPASFVPRT